MFKRTRMILFAGLLLATLLVVQGCAIGYMSYMDRTATPNIQSHTATDYQADGYDVLGTVEAVGESKCILGIVVEGTDGQGLLMKEAGRKFQGVTGIKDVSAYKEFEGILPPVYCKIETTYYGTAVAE